MGLFLYIYLNSSLASRCSLKYQKQQTKVRLAKNVKSPSSWHVWHVWNCYLCLEIKISEIAYLSNMPQNRKLNKKFELFTCVKKHESSQILGWWNKKGKPPVLELKKSNFFTPRWQSLSGGVAEANMLLNESLCSLCFCNGQGPSSLLLYCISLTGALPVVHGWVYC